MIYKPIIRSDKQIRDNFSDNVIIHCNTYFQENEHDSTIGNLLQILNLKYGVVDSQLKLSL